MGCPPIAEEEDGVPLTPAEAAGANFPAKATHALKTHLQAIPGCMGVPELHPQQLSLAPRFVTTTTMVHLHGRAAACARQSEDQGYVMGTTPWASGSNLADSCGTLASRMALPKSLLG